MSIAHTSYFDLKSNVHHILQFLTGSTLVRVVDVLQGELHILSHYLRQDIKTS